MPPARAPHDTLVMPPRWNAWTHLQSVQFDYEKAPKPRQVRLCGPSIVVGEPVRIGVSGVEVEAVVVGVEGGVLVVKIRRTPAKAPARSVAEPRNPKAKKRVG